VYLLRLLCLVGDDLADLAGQPRGLALVVVVLEEYDDPFEVRDPVST
jgi:hypothetical protein